MLNRFGTWALVAALCGLAVVAGNGQTSKRVYVGGHGSQRGHLGVMIQDVNARLKEKKHLAVDYGAYITNVDEDSPAEKAGIKEGDVVVSFNGKKIVDGGDLSTAVGETKPRTDVTIEFYRDADKKTVTATIGKSSGFSYSFGDHMTPMPPMPRIKPFALHVFTERSFQGLKVQDLGKQLAEYFDVPNRRGVLVTEVEKGSAGEKAGFKAGDVITKVKDVPVRKVEDLQEEFSDGDGKDAPFEVIRKGKSMTMTMRIEADDEEDDDDTSFNPAFPHDSFAPRGLHPHAMQGTHQTDLDWLRAEIEFLKARIRGEVEKVRTHIERTLLEL